MRSILEDRAISMEVFVARTGGDEAKAARLLSGDEPLTNEIAEQLAGLLGGTQRFWMNREKHYRDGLARGLKRIT